MPQKADRGVGEGVAYLKLTSFFNVPLRSLIRIVLPDGIGANFVMFDDFHLTQFFISRSKSAQNQGVIGRQALHYEGHSWNLISRQLIQQELNGNDWGQRKTHDDDDSH